MVHTSDIPGPAIALLPRWTVPSFERTSGKYPLGLEAVAMGQLADELASGLPVLSRHPRYWSLYTYIVKRFWDTGRTPRTNIALGRFLKAREIIFACAALRCPRHGEDLPGVIGSDTFAPWLRAHPEGAVPLDLHYLKQGLGGYGQIYRGGMLDLGLILAAENNPTHRVDAPFGELGAAVADAFAAAIAGTEYARRYQDQDVESIPVPVICELAEVSCFCRLAEHAAERDLLTDVLMGRAQPTHPAHAQRAQTVRMCLDLAAATAGTPLTDTDFRSLLYFGAVPGVEWWPAPPAEGIWRRWWLIQTREWIVAGLNALFTHLARWGLAHGGLLHPLAVDAYAASLAAMTLPADQGFPSGRLDEVAVADVSGVLAGVAARSGWPPSTALTTPVNEADYLRQAQQGRAGEAPVYALLTLLLVQQRLQVLRAQRDLAPEEEWMVRDGGVERLSTETVCTWLGQRQERGGVLAALLTELVRSLVIRQHLRVARGKLPEDTFRFHEEEGGLRFVDHGDAGLAAISIRFQALSTALHGLGLIAAPLTEAGHAPTARGVGLRRG